MNAGRAAGAPRILARMPNWLGDCIMALPALRFLRESFPEAELIAACRANLTGFMAAQPGVDRAVATPGSGVVRLVAGLAQGVPQLSGEKLPGGIDLGILFTNSLSTAAWLWRAGARNRIGYNLDTRRLFLTHPVRCDKRVRALHFVDYYLELAKRAVGIAASWRDRRFTPQSVMVDEDFLLPRLAVDAASKSRAASLLGMADVEGPYAVFAPASAYGPVKDWPPAHYRRLARALADRRGLPVILTGAGGQREVCGGIADGHGKIHNLAGKTDLGSFLGLVAGARLFVGGDSGGAHAAAAFGVPTLVIFGVTNPARTFPSGRDVAMLGKGSPEEVKLSTPKARALAEETLRNITVEEAEKAVGALLRD